MTRKCLDDCTFVERDNQLPCKDGDLVQLFMWINRDWVFQAGCAYKDFPTAAAKHLEADADCFTVNWLGLKAVIVPDKKIPMMFVRLEVVC